MLSKENQAKLEIKIEEEKQRLKESQERKKNEEDYFNRMKRL